MASGCVSNSFHRDLRAASKARAHRNDKFAVYSIKKDGNRYAKPDETFRTSEQAAATVQERERMNPGRKFEIVAL